MKAIIIARVSTKQQEEMGLSIKDIQLPQMRQYAKDKGLDVVKEFRFQETASQKLRRNFDEMIKYVKAREGIGAVIAFRVDRMTRNYRDAVEMDLLRTEYHKELHFVSDRLILTEKSVGRDIQDWDLKVFLAKQHINRCQEDTQILIASKMRKGEQYGLAPYGYKNERDEIAKKGTVRVLGFESGIVIKVFDLYTTGAHSYMSIADKLNTEYPSLGMTKRKVESILKNPYYYGERDLDGELHPHNYPTLISKETFDLATSIRTGRSSEKKKGKLRGKTGLYRGLIYCAECSCAFTPSPNRHTKLGRKVQSESYYYCTNAKKKHRKKPVGTNDKKLTEELGQVFKGLKIPRKDLEELKNSLRESHEGKKAFTQQETNFCRTEIDRYRNRIEKAYEDKIDGSITQEYYDEKRREWEQKKQECQDKLNRIDQADAEYYITATYLLDLASRSYELFKGSEDEIKRQIVTLVFQNLRIRDGKLLYELQKPFDSIFESAKRHFWGACVESVRKEFERLNDATIYIPDLVTAQR